MNRNTTAIIVAALVILGGVITPTAQAGWFDQNGATAGFGLVDATVYDWWAANVWNAVATGDGALSTWVNGSTQAYFVGAGAGTTYTVRLGASGSTATTLQNIAINTDGSGAIAGAAGNVTIGNVGDTGVLTLNAANSVGAQGGGTLTINNPINLNAKTMNFNGGNVVINGVVSGTGTSKIVFTSGTFGLTSGTLTLANTANTYAGRANSDYIPANYTLAVTKLANGGSNSSIGSSSANIGFNGGTLKFIGTGTQTSNLGFNIGSSGATVSADGATASDIITFSGAPTYTAANSARAITLTGSNTGNNTMGFVYGNNGSGVNTLTKNGVGTWVINQDNGFTGTVNVTAGKLKITKSGSLGGGTKNVDVIGSAWLELDGTDAPITCAASLTFRISGNSIYGIRNLAGANTINGGIKLTSGAGNGLVTVTGGSLTLAGTIQAIVTGGRSLTLNGTMDGNLVSGQIIDGTSMVSIIKEGIGTWTLSNANTYTGNTKVSGGTLTLSNNEAIKNSAFDTSGAGTLDLTDASINTLTMGGLIGDASTGQNLVLPSNVTSLTLNPTVSTVTNTYVKDISRTGGGTGLTLNKSGTGTQVLSGSNSYTGATTISAGVLSVTTAAALGNTSSVSVTGTAAAGVLELGNGVTVSGKSITISGYGTGVRGALRAASGATAEWAGPVTIGGIGSPTDNRVGAMDNGTLTISGKISDGTQNIFIVSAEVALGAGKVIVSGANNYTGQTQIMRGTLALGADNSLPTGTILNVHAGSTVADPAVFDLNNYDQEVAGLYRGATNGGVTGTAEVTNSSGTIKTLTINNTSNYTFDSSITGNLALTKSGGGQQTLSGNNGYTGKTLINNGTLALGVGGSIGNSATIDVAASAYFDVSAVSFTLGSSQTLKGNGTLVGSVIIAGTLSPGNSIGTFNTGTLTIGSAGTGTFDVELGRSGLTPVSDAVIVAGTVTLNSGANLKLTPGAGLNTPQLNDIFYLVDNQSGSAVNGVFTQLNGANTTLGEGSNFYWDSKTWKITYQATFGSQFTGGNDIALQVIPEPSALALVGLGLLGLVFTSRRFRRQA